MHFDFLIIGQGISGTMLSWFLHKEGKTFLVIDDPQPLAASRVAAGIINPVTGRRYAYTWMIDEVMGFAVDTYREMEKYFDETLVHERSIIDFFPSAQMRNAFVERITENDTYLHSFPDQNHFNQYFNYDFGCGEIRPAFMINLQLILTGWRQQLQIWEVLKEEKFEISDLEITDDQIRYHNSSADKILFCDGAHGVQNPWFEKLPFAPNKGEVLIIECDDLLNRHVYKKGLILAPLQDNQYWVGSNYQWSFEDDKPSDSFYKQATTLLDGWLKKSYRVIEHKASIRPATLERRPFIGFHPVYEQVGIFNGLGTKGTSLAPFFANQLVQHIVHHLPLTPEADVRRFSRILERNA
ncbi:MAG: NAD(P)/FAD-dependent oxidoreductase [Flavisolibacter sp.]